MSIGTNSSNYIRSLIDNSSDAMQNLYYIQFSGSAIADISEALKVRVKDFTPPVFTQNKNSVSYMTVSTDMPGSEITGDKSLSFTFRLDSNYKVYEYLLKQQAATMVANNGWATSGVPNASDSDGGLTIRVFAFDRSLGSDPDNDENYRNLYSFYYCWIKQLSGMSFTYDSDTPMIIKADINFLDFEDPMNLLNASVRKSSSGYTLSDLQNTISSKISNLL